LPTDSARKIAHTKPTRAQAGLPEDGFVFCGFNAIHKIMPDMFAVWMRLLHTNEGSVLWLSQANAAAIRNLKRQAAAHGIAPERIVFASYLPAGDEHLARLSLADLFLDTLPYNAHTTACDALWAGVPVVTAIGSTFAGRVAASLLCAIGMPEQVAQSLDDYEARALELARNPALLSAVKEKLARNRETQPLFDTAGFTRGLEAAYTAMWRRHQRGLPPEGFAVDGGTAP
jgi:predicted O-linked N-acetylglucosamine transferase (SPINDLY family)